MSLWRIAIDESTGAARSAPEPVITGVQAAPALPSFSADGRRMVFRSSRVTANPVAVDFDPDTLQVGEGRYLMQRTGRMDVNDVSPDGQWLALHNLGERQEDIFVGRVDGSELRRLTDDLARDRFPRWAPTAGRWCSTQIATAATRRGVSTVTAAASHSSPRPAATSTWYPALRDRRGRRR